jgi:multiple sugar transport system substrate-binding protein
MKRSSVVTGLTVLALSLTACSGADGTGSDEADDTTPDGPVTIRFASHIAGIDGAVTAFNESQDDVVVEFEQYPSPAEGGLAKLTNGITAGNAPDLATVEYPDLPSIVSGGGIVPVTDIAADVLGEMPENILSAVTFADDRWAVPYDAPPMVYFYRADVFEAAGVDVPTTWEEFEAAGKAVAEENPGTAIASFYPNEPKLLAGLSWQAGAQWFGTTDDSWIVDIAGGTSQDVAELWQRMVDDDTARYQQAFSEDWANDLDSGSVAGVVGAVWGAAGLASRTESSAGEWRVAELPTWDGAPASALYGGSTFVVAETSEHPEAAAEFAQWLATSPDGLEARGDFGVAYPAAPALREAAKAAVDTAHFGGQDIYEVFDAASESVVEGWSWGPTQSTWETLSDQLGKANSGSTIGDALDATQGATVTDMEASGLSVTQ